MRLLELDDTGEIRLTKIFVRDIPEYAILSQYVHARDIPLPPNNLERGVTNGYMPLAPGGRTRRRSLSKT